MASRTVKGFTFTAEHRKSAPPSATKQPTDKINPKAKIQKNLTVALEVSAMAPVWWLVSFLKSLLEFTQSTHSRYCMVPPTHPLVVAMHKLIGDFDFGEEEFIKRMKFTKSDVDTIVQKLWPSESTVLHPDDVSFITMVNDNGGYCEFDYEHVSKQRATEIADIVSTLFMDRIQEIIRAEQEEYDKEKAASEARGLAREQAREQERVDDAIRLLSDRGYSVTLTNPQVPAKKAVQKKAKA